MLSKVNLEQVFTFENARVLSNFEANELLSSVRGRYDESYNQNENKNVLFDKANNYAAHCQQFKDKAQLHATREAIKSILQKDSEERESLTEAEQDKRDKQIEYDTVMLLNLCPNTREEARTYLTTGYNDDQIDAIIEQFTKFSRI